MAINIEDYNFAILNTRQSAHLLEVASLFTARCYALRARAIRPMRLYVVCPPVRPSVTFIYRDHNHVG